VLLSDFKRLIAPLQKKIFLLLGRAILRLVENAEGTQKIQVTALSNETISDIERFQEYGFETFPHDEAEVFIGFLNGNRDHGIALVVHDRRYRPTNLVAGEVMLYTDEDTSPGDFHIHLKRDRIFDIKGDKVTEIQDTSKSITTPSEAHINTIEHIVDCPKISLGESGWAALKKMVHEDFITLFNTHTHAQGNDNNGDVQDETEVPTVLGVIATHATTKVRGE